MTEVLKRFNGATSKTAKKKRRLEYEAAFRAVENNIAFAESISFDTLVLHHADTDYTFYINKETLIKLLVSRRNELVKILNQVPA